MVPICAMFLLFQLLTRRFKRTQLLRIVSGLIYTYVASQAPMAKGSRKVAVMGPEATPPASKATPVKSWGTKNVSPREMAPPLPAYPAAADRQRAGVYICRAGDVPHRRQRGHRENGADAAQRHQAETEAGPICSYRQGWSWATSSSRRSRRSTCSSSRWRRSPWVPSPRRPCARACLWAWPCLWASPRR